MPTALHAHEYDVAIVGCGVGGHAAALHSITKGLKTAVFTAKDVGGTCVNRGCVPSKALLAATGKIRMMKDSDNLQSLGVHFDSDLVNYDSKQVAKHASDLASNVRDNLRNSLEANGVHVIDDAVELSGKNELKSIDSASVYTAKNIILATGSVPFVPPGVEVDGETVYTSDTALSLPSVPEYCAIVGSGYIGLEFSDVLTAMGTEVTFIEALPDIMPTFDREIAKQAERILIRPRPIDYRTGVFASEVIPGEIGKKPCTVKMIDAKTKEHVETIEPDAVMIATGRVPNTQSLNLASCDISTTRNFVDVDETMRVKTTSGDVLDNIYAIGDCNGVMMLAHAASAQGISAVENICSNRHVVNHNNIPAACFTHPEISMVGYTEEQAAEKAKEEGWELAKSVGSFRANSKALAENSGGGIAKVLYKKDTLEIVGVHIIGLHAADLIQECANAMATGTTLRELSMIVHTHPTLSEVLDEAFKGAVGMKTH